MRITRAIQFPYRTAGVNSDTEPYLEFDSHYFFQLKTKLAKLADEQHDNHIAYVFQTDSGEWFCVSFSDWRMILRYGTSALWLDEPPSDHVFLGETESKQTELLRKLREAGLLDLAKRCEERWLKQKSWRDK